LHKSPKIKTVATFFEKATGSAVNLLESLFANLACTRRHGRAAIAAAATETTSADLHHDSKTIGACIFAVKARLL